MSEELFKLSGVRKSYGENFTLDIPSLIFEKGRIYALVGPNGSGKTTLLNLLNLLEEPTEGQILFESQDVSECDPIEIRRQMAMVAQDPFLFHTTVFKNVAYGLKIRSYSRSTIEKRVPEYLELVGLVGFDKRKAYKLSGGEAQRVAIARAICIEPKALLLDEPTANVDKRNVEIIEGLISKINERLGTTIIFATHDLAQAYRLTDDIVSLVDGRIVETTPENIFYGDVVEANGLKYLMVSENVKISLVAERSDKAHIFIDPRDIILSSKPLESSARNSFLGRITQVVDDGPQVRLSAKTDGTEFISVITKKSLYEMGLTLGSEVFVTFKTSAVKVL